MDQECTQKARDAFDRGANSVEAWLRSAESLALAACTLRQNRPPLPPLVEMKGVEALRLHQLLWPELMLWGMAIEDFLKCFILKRGGSLGSGGKYCGHGGHNLSTLANEASFCLTKEELRIVDRLSSVILWSGRYPVAKNFSNTFGWRQWVSPVHDEIVDSIVVRLRTSVANEDTAEPSLPDGNRLVSE